MRDEAGQGCTLWAPVTGEGLSAIEKAGWLSWPNTVELRATKVRGGAAAAAMALAREFGVGYVVRFHLRTDAAETDPALASLDVGALSADRALASAIMNESQYRGRVDDDEIARAEAAMGHRFPAAWRAYLQRPSRFYKGWLATRDFVWLKTPAESLDTALIWRQLDIAPPGMIPMGSDGASEILTVDARNPESPVTLTNHVDVSWEDSMVQCPSIEAFLRAIESDTFRFVFGDEKVV